MTFNNNATTPSEPPLPPFKVVIPARFGATRLPGKPLIDIGGRPLIAHVWASACASQAEEVLIATEDARIAAACEGFGAEAVMTSAQHLSGSDRIGEVMRQRGWPEDTLVVNLQGDEPCMPAALIDQVARLLVRHPEVGMATLSVPIDAASARHDPHLVKVVTDARGAALYFSRAPIPWHREAFAADHTQTASAPPPLSPMLQRHIGIYAYRVGLLARFLAWPPAPLEQIEALEQLRVLWHGERIQVEEACTAIGPGVDTQADLAGVRQWLGLASKKMPRAKTRGHFTTEEVSERALGNQDACPLTTL